MTHDVIQQLEVYGAYADAIAPAISPDELNRHSAERIPARTPPRRAVPYWAVAIGAAVAVFILIGGVVWLLGGSRGDVVEQPMVTTPAVPPTMATTTPAEFEPTTPVVLPAVAVCPADSTPNLPGPQDQARPIPTEEWGVAAVDYESGRLITHSVGGWQDGTLRDAQTWAFDLCANTWQAMEPEVEPAGFLHVLVYAAGSDLIVGVNMEGQTWTYDYDSDTWTQKRDAPELIGDAVYDSASDTVVAVERLSTWTYDVDTDTWTSRSELPIPVTDLHSRLMTYDRTLDRIVAWVKLDLLTYDSSRNTATWLYDTDSDEWTQVSTDTPWINTGYGKFGGLFAHHERSGLSVMYAGSQFASFDGTRQAWTHREDPELRDTSLDRADHAFEYDPVNDRIVLVGGIARMDEDVIWVTRDDVWAYDPATDEWTMLLATSGTSNPNN